MGIELLIFDWSGTISDDRKPVHYANNKMLTDYGKHAISFEEWLSNTAGNAVQFMAKFGIEEDGKTLQELYVKYYNEAIAEGICPTVYSDADDVLRFFKGRNKSLAVLSSHMENNLRGEAEKYKLTDLFELLKGDVFGKPAGIVEIYRHFKKNPSDTAYIGDTTHDIEAAKKAGVVSIGVCTGYHTKKKLSTAKPDILVNYLTKLKAHKLLK